MTGPRRSPQTDPPPPSRATIHQTFWPKVDTVEAASRVARYGFWAAAINAALSALLLYLLLDVGAAVPVPATQVMIWWAAADSAISVVVAIGMWFYLPVAAAAGLVLFIASRAFNWLFASPQPDLTAILIAVLFVYFYVLGVRGAFARRRLLAGGGGSGRR